MKKILAAILIIISQSNTFAYWEEIGTTGAGETTFYIDRSTIRKNNIFHRIWTLSNNKTPDRFGVNSGTALVEIDCSNDKYRFLQMTAFGGQMAYGKEIVSNNDTTGWIYAAPGTINAKIASITCNPQ